MSKQPEVCPHCGRPITDPKRGDCRYCGLEVDATTVRPALQPYTVRLDWEGETGVGFACQAEDDAHAREQAINAYPGCTITSVRLTAAPATADDWGVVLALAGNYLESISNDSGVDADERMERLAKGDAYDRVAAYVDSPLAKQESRLLECSTAHMTREDAEALTGLVDASDNWFPLLAARFNEGFFIRVHRIRTEGGTWAQTELAKAGMSPAFVAFCTLVANQGFDTILFDRDADSVEGQPTFDW